MAYEILGRVKSYPAGVDLSAKQYYICTVDNTGKAQICGAGGAAIMGVLQNKPKATYAAGLSLDGANTPVYAGGSIAIGDLITSNALGMGVKATAGSVASGTAGGPLYGEYTIGWAESAAGSGEYFTLTQQSPRLLAGTVV
jgi:hypothetical protein